MTDPPGRPRRFSIPCSRLRRSSFRRYTTRHGAPSSPRPSAVARCSLLAGAILLLLPAAGEGQLVVGANASELRASESPVIEGRGIQVRGSYGVGRWLRVTGAASREWGDEEARDPDSGRLTNENESSFSSLQVGLEMLSPRRLGTRLSAGVHLSRHDLSAYHLEYYVFDAVGQRYEYSDRSGYGWSLGLEGPGILGGTIRPQAGFSETRVDLRNRTRCRNLANECSRTPIRRVTIGIGVSIL